MGKPGTKLKMLLLSLKIRAKGHCDCESIMRDMDRLGVDGCKRDRKLLIERLRENAKEYGIGDWMVAAMGAVGHGLAFSINPLDPIPSLFDEAVRRAESKTAESKQKEESRE